MKRLHHYFLLVLGIIVVDQLVKLLVYQTMYQEEYFEILGISWMKIHFTTNEGMAFGAKLGGDYGKIILSLFRLGAVILIGFYLKKIYLKGAKKGLLICLSLILAGAIGNLVDSMFYGLFADDLLASNAPFRLFHGKVIDMAFLDLAKGYYPDWVPLIGGDFYSFIPIFNVADSVIFVAVVIILIRQKAYFGSLKQEESK